MSQAISGVSGFNAERLGAVLSMRKNAAVEAGQQTLKLIQSAAILPSDQGANLDVSG